MADVMDPAAPDLSQLRVYLNQPAPCPYLPDRSEQRLLVPLADEPSLAAAQLSFFTQLGFRRSQNFMYRPHCGACQACISYRLPVTNFLPNDNQRRTRLRNRDLTWTECPVETAAALYPLFTAYQQAWHADGEMASFTAEDFALLLRPTVRHETAIGSFGTTCFILQDAASNTIGAMLVDRTAVGLSAVYSFYDPVFNLGRPQRSLGTELVLRLIAQARAEGSPHIYLGYWVEASSKMNYKNRFRPAEVLTERGWQSLV